MRVGADRELPQLRGGGPRPFEVAGGDEDLDVRSEEALARQRVHRLVHRPTDRGEGAGRPTLREAEEGEAGFGRAAVLGGPTVAGGRGAE